MKNSPVMHPQVPEAGDSQKTKLLIPIDATEESRWAIHYAIRRARATRPAPIAIPIIGTEAMPTANASDVSMNSSRAPMP